MGQRDPSAARTCPRSSGQHPKAPSSTAIPRRTLSVRAACTGQENGGPPMAEEDRSRLIDRELLLRKKAKTIVVAAPPSVPEQWKAGLEERFGLVFEILDRTYLARMRRERGFGVNPWRTH